MLPVSTRVRAPRHDAGAPASRVVRLVAIGRSGGACVRRGTHTRALR
jgi:hypothetical protein